MLARMRTARGVARSLRIYYGNRQRRAAMDRLYRRFIKPGDLVFDIGAHVGDRIASFRRLGARVVAVEPQPALVTALRWLYGRDRRIAIEPAAVGRRCGAATLRLNVDNPTVSTASEDFISAAHAAPGWERENWSSRVEVPMTTVDALISRHGRPAFVKIDVEGYEAEALFGLSQVLPALSFEFTTIQRAIARAAIERCVKLGFTGFNAALGESQTLVFETCQERRDDRVLARSAAIRGELGRYLRARAVAVEWRQARDRCFGRTVQYPEAEPVGPRTDRCSK